MIPFKICMNDDSYIYHPKVSAPFRLKSPHKRVKKNDLMSSNIFKISTLKVCETCLVLQRNDEIAQLED